MQNTQCQVTTNPGLWLDKYIFEQKRDATDSRVKLINDVTGIQLPDIYQQWLEKWTANLKRFDAEIREAEVNGRIVVGLGSEGVLETSITLHKTYGVPYIPGCALKGVAARFARQHLDDNWKADGGSYVTLFGNTDNAGYVTFFDAMPTSNVRMCNDIITVHHKDYYGGNKPPADWDDPTPIPFISVTGKYYLALAGPENWVQPAFEILEHALNYLGVGAKTSSGYGRLKLTSEKLISRDSLKTQVIIEQIRTLNKNDVAGLMKINNEFRR